MLGRRVRSALLIDLENANRYCPPDKIDTWISWLEEGEFDENARKRRLVQKRIYLNASQIEKYRAPFEAKQFEVVLCETLTQVKNGLDIRLTLDVMESLSGKIRSVSESGKIITKPAVRVDEYIIFATDSDYVPMLQRIKLYNKRSAILGDEEKAPNVFRKLTDHANVVIPVRVATTAADYSGPEPLWGRLRRSVSNVFTRPPEADEEEASQSPAMVIANAEVPLPGAPPQRRRRRRRRRPPVKDHEGAMAAATRATIRIISLTPNGYTARTKIERELRDEVPSFSTKGPDKYLRKGSFLRLMEELASRDDRIKVHTTAGRLDGVRYEPRDES